EQAEQSWVSWRVHSAIETLPDNERRLIELAYWSGLSQSEIAGLEGIPLGTVKTRTRSALARLAVALEEELRGRTNLISERSSVTRALPRSLTGSGRCTT